MTFTSSIAVTSFFRRGFRSLATLMVALSALVAGGSMAFAQSVHPQSGWWWNATEAGRGYSIEVTELSDPHRAYFGAFMYGDSGQPVWYAALLTAGADGNTFTGQLKYYQRGLSSVGSLPAGTDTGTIRITFTSATEGTIELLVNGSGAVATTIPITRFPIVDSGLFGAQWGGFPFPELGWWWNPLDQGRGMFFEVQSDAATGPMLFAVFYGYEADGTPSWTVGVSPLLQTAGGGWLAQSMVVYRCTGGQVLTRTGPQPPACLPADGGQVNLVFAPDGRHAEITLSDGSRTAIERFEF